jgi:hypothetical protein
VGPAAAVTLGVLLLPAAIVDLPDRGSMVPSGGGTIDGGVLGVALSADDGVEAAVGWLVTCVLTLVTAASLTDLAGVGTRMQRDDGVVARSAALGVTLVAIGLVMLRRRPSRRKRMAWAPPAG